MSETKTILRHSTPTEYDQLEMDTLCNVVDENGLVIQVFIQRSKDSNFPIWVELE